MYRSLVAQTLHYFARPHMKVRRTPVRGSAAWKGSEIGDNWRATLTVAQIDEVDRALSIADRVAPMSALRRSDIPLPCLEQSIVAWRRELTHGRGFVVISGVPVERWGDARSERFFWALGLHLGIPGAQNPQGDLLGHVIDTGASAEDVRAYRTSANIGFHCDAADVVGLLCLRAAKSGGLSRIVSSIAVYDALVEQRPDLIDRLYEPFELDTHGEGGIDHFPIAPCRHAGGRLRTFWHSDYFRSATRYADVTSCARDLELLDVYDAIASDPAFYLDMELRPGDVQLLSNHTILHARTAYVDHNDPALKRHLLRLWLSLESQRGLDRALALANGVGLVRSLLARRAQRAIRGPSPRRTRGEREAQNE